MLYIFCNYFYFFFQLYKPFSTFIFYKLDLVYKNNSNDRNIIFDRKGDNQKYFNSYFQVKMLIKSLDSIN